MRPTKTILIILAFADLPILLLTLVAQAHEFKSDGPIGALLHIDPDDSAIAGEAAHIYLAFKDENEQFTPSNCDCILTIARNGSAIYSGPVAPLQNSAYGSNVLSMEYNFPSKGIYTLTVKGSSSEKKFQPFQISYDIRVEREVARPVNTLPYLLGGVAAMIIVIVAFIIKFRKRS